MGLFNWFSKNKRQQENQNFVWKESINQLNKNKISTQGFVNINAEQTLYCSTPVGEDIKGEMNVWLLSKTDSDTKYYPAFTSKKLCCEIFASIGRKDFMIIEGSLESTLKSLDSHPMLEEAGLLIHDDDDVVEIPPKMRVQK